MTLATRQVLSAPSSDEQTRTLNRVILAVSILSVLGAGWMILSFLLFKSARTFRHQLILGLAISDFWMAVNFVSSTSYNLSGHDISASLSFCNLNGFMTQLFVVQTDYWVLIIAVSTFLALANFKRSSAWAQEHRIILWSIPWVLSALWAGLGLGLAGYRDIGAWCWFASDQVRLLVNFIPRWLIIAIILVLYLRLYFLIFRAHESFMSFDQETGRSIQPESGSVSSTRQMGRPINAMCEMDSADDDYGRAGIPASRKFSRAGRPNPALKKIARQMMIYPLVYMFIWALPTIVRIYQSVTGRSAPFVIGTIDKSCIAIQGFADAIIYGVNESSMAVWRQRFSRRGTQT